MRKLLLWVVVIAGLIGAAICTVMAITAARFLEWGRVVFYFTIGLFCLEAAVLSVSALRRNRDDS